MKNDTLPYVLGITGGIGSGKSVVSHILRIMGIPVYDCDSEAKRLNCTDPIIRRGLTDLVGESVYHSDGTLNKGVLASYLFESSDNATHVNAIIHPRVKEDFKVWKAEHAHCEWVGIESAILIESGFSVLADRVITVLASENVRVKRAAFRDGVSEEQVQQRIRQQMDDEERRKNIDLVVENDEGKPLIPQILDILAFLLCSFRS